MARAKDGSDVNATIVGAVAAKYRSSDRIHVELTEDRTGSVRRGLYIRCPECSVTELCIAALLKVLVYSMPIILWLR